MAEEFDCAIIGAGWYGLAAAKQLYCTQPGAKLAVIDAQSSVGGTWADERFYPGLKSNNLVGTYEYPDFPMDFASFGVAKDEHIPGAVVNRYLKAYAAHFGIDKLVRLNTKITSVEHLESDGGWDLLAKSPERLEGYAIHARRLVMATGLTSEAILPRFDGQETFGGKIFHGKYFQQNSDTLETAKAVTVVGGTKFAWDAVYAYAMAGVEVNWVIRSSGHGPSWIAPPYVTPLKKWIEKLANTRMLTWLSPCIWGSIDGYPGIRRFLHGTTIGRLITDTFWGILGNDTLSLVGFDKHPETAKLKPWLPAMFAGTSFSILNYDTDFMEIIRRGDLVKIHISDVDHLSPGKVHLADGQELASDAILAHTGWKHVPPIQLDPDLAVALGMPHKTLSREQAARYTPPAGDLGNRWDLLDRADEEIFARFPRLRDQPVWNEAYVPLAEQRDFIGSAGDTAPLTPWTLHRFMVPADPRFLRRRDVAFVGVVSNFSNTLTAHLQGLWVSAYFQGKLSGAGADPSAAVDGVGAEAALARLRYETVLVNRFGRWRYPTDWGSKSPSFIFDAVPYLDQMMVDLGLNPHRKKEFLAEWYSPYGAEEYRGVTEEWLSKQAQQHGDKKVD